MQLHFKCVLNIILSFTQLSYTNIFLHYIEIVWRNDISYTHTCRFALLRILQPLRDGCLSKTASPCERWGLLVKRHRYSTFLISLLLTLQTCSKSTAYSVTESFTLGNCRSKLMRVTLVGVTNNIPRSNCDL